MSLSAIASISSISSISVLDTAFTLASSSKLSPTPPASSASTISAADLRKDLSALLSSLASGDLAAARAGLAQLEADTQISPADAGEVVATTPVAAGSSATSLAHVLSESTGVQGVAGTSSKTEGGASSAGASSEVASVSSSEEASSSSSTAAASASTATASSTQFSNSVHSLLTKVAGSLNSGSIDAAVSDLTGFLTKDGHSTGNLLSTAA